MKKIILLLALLPVIGLVVGCGSSAPVVATVGSEKITVQEFEDVYAKNNGGWESGKNASAESRRKFLDLLLNFRLKVAEARAQGLLQDTAIVNELDSYRTSVAQTYVLEKELIEPSIHALYDRKKEELRASHILIQIRTDANGKPDTLAAYQKANEARMKVLQGARFDSIARGYSDDPSVSRNNGDLGFFNSGRMVPEFEDACYALKPGEIAPSVVRTQFGYHVIKLTARQLSKGSVDLSHIFFRLQPGGTDSTAVRDSAWAVYRALRAKEFTFTDAVQRFTTDLGTKRTNGRIGTLERSQIPPPLAETIFRTEKDSLSEPVASAAGYHIFFVNSYTGVGSFEENAASLKQLFQQQHYERAHTAYLSGLHKQYGLQFDRATRSWLEPAFDSTKSPGDSAWMSPIPADAMGKTVFSVGATRVDVKTLLDQIQRGDEFRQMTLTPATVERLINRLADDRVFNEHAKTAAARHPNFARLMDEYRDGVLMYRVEQDEVWKRIVVNDSLLKIHYDTAGYRFRWPDRVSFAEVFVTSDSLAKAASWKLRFGERMADVAEEYTMRPGYKERHGVWELTPYDKSPLSQKASTMAPDSISAPFRTDNGWSIIQTIAKEPARQKTFEEASAELSGSYQEIAFKQQEHAWLESLRNKFGVTVNDSVLAEAFKGPPRGEK